MTPVSLRGEGQPLEQHNHSSGMFVGRDNISIQAVDAKTKELLAKVSVAAPALGKLLQQALRDGVISPEAAFAISRAARSINEDVASDLYAASRRINEDVAASLVTSSRSINEQVASTISDAARTLAEAVDRLSPYELQQTAKRMESASREIGTAVSTLQNQAVQIGQATTVRSPSSSNKIAQWRALAWSFVWGFMAGALLIAYWMKSSRA